MKTTWITIGTCVLVLMMVGCGKEKLDRAWSFMPNMHDQESVRAFEPEPSTTGQSANTMSAMRQPVAGTIPMGFNHYERTKMSPDSAKDINPLPMSMEVLKAGRRAYDIYCIVCHGERGDGNGNIIPDPNNPGFSNSGREYLSKSQFPPPPPLYSDRVNGMSDGELFNYITKGGALMPKYDHLTPETRWSIVNFVRVLYRASRATDEEVADYQANEAQYRDPQPTTVINDWK